MRIAVVLTLAALMTVALTIGAVAQAPTGAPQVGAPGAGEAAPAPRTPTGAPEVTVPGPGEAGPRVRFQRAPGTIPSAPPRVDLGAPSQRGPMAIDRPWTTAPRINFDAPRQRTPGYFQPAERPFQQTLPRRWQQELDQRWGGMQRRVPTLEQRVMPEPRVPQQDRFGFPRPAPDPTVPPPLTGQ